MTDSASARDIIERLVKQSGITKKLAAEILHAIPDIIEAGLKKDGEVRVKGLGTFRLKQVKAKAGRNPKTGERVEIPPHSHVVFLPEQSLKDYINRDYRLLSYKIIPPAETVSPADEIHAEPEILEELTDQYKPYLAPEPVPSQTYQPQYQPKTEPEVYPDSPSSKRRVHWIVPVAISVIIILSLVFYLRNFYHSSQQSAISSQQPAVSSQQPAVSSQQPAVSSQQSAAGGR
jgi:nucleoid DNA-binding protein